MRIPLLSRKHRIFALIGAILIGAVGGAAYIHAHQESTAVISLVYQNASHGLYPDGTRIDAYLATSEDVLSAAEATLGYEIQRDSIWVRPSYSGKGSTYATDYTITYDGTHGDPVLRAVVNAWENAFSAHTGTNRSMIAYESYPADMDYIIFGKTGQTYKLINTYVSGTDEERAQVFDELARYCRDQKDAKERNAERLRRKAREKYEVDYQTDVGLVETTKRKTTRSAGTTKSKKK